ncbi:MAG: ABC transporter substrate-binding protein [Hyphomicrobiaceae bacterium]
MLKSLRASPIRSIAAAALLAWAPSAAMAQDKAYTIGVSLGLTGVQGAVAQRQIKAIELATEMINAKGGIHGRPLKLVVEDDQTKPDLAVTKVLKLIDEDHVLAIVGGNSGDTAMAIGAIAERKGVPLLSPTGFNKTPVQKGYKYSFLMIPDYDDAIESLVKYSVEQKKCSKIGLLRLTRLWGVQASDAYKAMTKKYNATIVSEETLNDGDKDMTPQLTNIKATAPCAVAIWAAVPTAAISIKNARQIGIDAPLLGNPIFAAASTPEIAGDASEGVVGTATLVAGDPLPRQQAYVNGYKEKYTLAADMWDAAAFDAVNLVAKAIGSLPADKVTPGSLRDQLATTKDFEGAGAIVDFTKNQWPLSSSWVMITVKDKKAVRLTAN